MKIRLNSAKILFPALIALGACASGKFDAPALEEKLTEYANSKDCRIGIAVIYEGDTISVNGSERFPMLSVYKFPQAIAVGRLLEEQESFPDDSVYISESEILRDTYSPMRERYGVTSMRLPIGELMQYSLVVSDNNACDILFRLIGGPAVADSVVRSLGFHDISLVNTEAEMNENPELCYSNSATPVGIASLMDAFYDSISDSGVWMHNIKVNLEMCSTGVNRIPGANFEPETLIGHKTGTGPVNPEGRIIAINDVGYIELPCGRSYTLAVLISDSPYSREETEGMIGEISEIVRAEIAQ